jgi:hypothetical protein
LFELGTSNIQRPTSNIESKAVLKHVQSKRWRDCRASLNFAKRLKCERFTAALRCDMPYGQTASAAVICPDTTGNDRDRSQMVNTIPLGMKKRFARITVAAVIVTALVFAYIYRTSFLESYSRLYHQTGFEQSIVDDWVYSKSISHFNVLQWVRIRWDSWCIAIPVSLEKPRLAGDRILVLARATDRTDVEFLYVFDHDWHFIKVFHIPLA